MIFVVWWYCRLLDYLVVVDYLLLGWREFFFFGWKEIDLSCGEVELSVREMYFGKREIELGWECVWGVFWSFNKSVLIVVFLIMVFV